MTVEIGKRWRPGHRVYRDDDTGDYSKVNSPMVNECEWRVQRALLTKPKRESGQIDILMGQFAAGQAVVLPLGVNLISLDQPPRTHS
jgi:hypothetical protein